MPSIPAGCHSRRAIMIARFIERLLSEDQAWDNYVDIFAGLPDNY